MTTTRSSSMRPARSRRPRPTSKRSSAPSTPGTRPAASGSDLVPDALLDVATSTARHVAVAIDAAGAAGNRRYSYLVPETLADLEPGEAVMVEFGRRLAIAVVLGDAPPPEGITAKPVLGRVRADGPLIPPLGLRLVEWIADHYLAPPALVIRAVVPPGMLERFELLAERTSVAAPEGLSAAERDLLDQLERGSRPVRSLVAADGRVTLLRRVRDLADRGLITLDWTLLAAAVGPRYERWIRLTPSGHAALVDEAQRARPLGNRQLGVLDELVRDAPDPGGAGLPATPLGEGHGTAAIASLARRGLVAVDVRERPRRPLAGRPVGLRGSRPPGAPLTEPQAVAVAAVRAAIAAGSHTPILLDGVTGGGKTAIYVEAIVASLERGRPALVLVPEIALALPLVDRLRADLAARVALVHSGLGEGERADEWRRIRAGDVDIVVGTRLAVLAPLADVGLIVVDEEHDPAYKSDRTPRLQARDAAVRLAQLGGAAIVLGSATPAVESVGHVRDGTYRRVALPSRPSGAPPRVEVVDLREELRAGN